MISHRFVYGLALLLAAGGPAWGELPPLAYASMKEKAPVVLNLLPIKVTSSLDPAALEDSPGDLKLLPYSVNVQALVLKIHKGADQLKGSDTISIAYQRRNLPESYVGPPQVPVLEIGKVYRAFLATDAATPDLLLPAAKGQSFELLTDS
ncbi:MAG: hypothetical protein AAGK14_05230 [Verrucomicrobiota bacterium]